MMGSYCRPSVTVPYRSLDKPTKACRPNSSPPCARFPVLSSKPFSSVKTALRPPPRSSDPLSPQRDPFRPLLASSRNSLPPLLLPATGTLLIASKPSSMMPYNVMLLCACAAGTDTTRAHVTRIFFIGKLAGCRRRPQRVESASRSDIAEAEERKIKGNGRNERRLNLFRRFFRKRVRDGSIRTSASRLDPHQPFVLVQMQWLL